MDIDPSLAISAAVSLNVGYLVYQASGTMLTVTAAIFAFAAASMIMKAGVMGSLAALTNPFVTFIAAFPLAFIYFGIEGGSFWPVAMKSLGAGFLAVALSMMMFNYWNIGG